jgi:hypothetical protein
VILCLLPFRVVGLPQFYGATFYMKEIELTRGFIAFVDDQDFDELNKFKWRVCIYGRNIYAERTSKRDHNGKKKNIRMHRQVMRFPKGKVVDHRDHNGLNNQRANLRLCTVQQNALNNVGTPATSKFVGVCWNKSCKKWNAYISFNRKSINLGLYLNEEDAAIARNKKAIELFGEFANLNKIEPAMALKRGTKL